MANFSTYAQRRIPSSPSEWGIGVARGGVLSTYLAPDTPSEGLGGIQRWAWGGNSASRDPYPPHGRTWVSPARGSYLHHTPTELPYPHTALPWLRGFGCISRWRTVAYPHHTPTASLSPQALAYTRGLWCMCRLGAYPHNTPIGCPCPHTALPPEGTRVYPPLRLWHTLTVPPRGIPIPTQPFHARGDSSVSAAGEPWQYPHCTPMGRPALAHRGSPTVGGVGHATSQQRHP